MQRAFNRALVALLALSSAQLPLVASGATIQNVVAPRQSGPALNFKGNTAWPYGLCEVSGEIDGFAYSYVLTVQGREKLDVLHVLFEVLLNLLLPFFIWHSHM